MSNDSNSSNVSSNDSNLSNCSSRRSSFSPTSTVPAVPGCSPVSKKVSDLRLILVNFVVAGLEIASSVAFTFIPPLLLKSGYSETQMSIIFGVGKNAFCFCFTLLQSEYLLDAF